MTWKNSVASIFIAPAAEGTMVAVSAVRAVPGAGLEGDRYFLKVGTYSNHPGTGRHVTLIESEAFEALKRDYGIDLEPASGRRNIVTRGVPQPSSRARIRSRRHQAPRHALVRAVFAFGRADSKRRGARPRSPRRIARGYPGGGHHPRRRRHPPDLRASAFLLFRFSMRNDLIRESSEAGVTPPFPAFLCVPGLRLRSGS